MRWKNLKKAGLLALVISMSGVLSSPVMASSILDEVTDEETTESHSEDISYSRLRGNNLNFGSTEITKFDVDEVGLSGLTQCHHSCATVYLDIYLERKVNGTYSTYKSWEFTANNVAFLSKDIDVIVPSGYYYRVRGYHAAKDGGFKESTTTLTKGILIK